MELETSPELESSLRIWPVAETLSTYLPVGDLISLSRSSSSLRASLHGFSEPYESDPPGPQGTPRQSLNIGQHDTPSWHRLKHLAPFECSSPKHTKKNLSPSRVGTAPDLSAMHVSYSHLSPVGGRTLFRIGSDTFAKHAGVMGTPAKATATHSTPPKTALPRQIGTILVAVQKTAVPAP